MAVISLGRHCFQHEGLALDLLSRAGAALTINQTELLLIYLFLDILVHVVRVCCILKCPVPLTSCNNIYNSLIKSGSGK